MANPSRCSHERCKCTVDASTAINRDGQQYCSQRCADDRGCDHEDCNCGKFPTAEVSEHAR